MGFPDGSVVKNPPSNTGQVGLIPDPGRSHMRWSNYACEPQLLSPRVLEPVLCNKSCIITMSGPHLPQ